MATAPDFRRMALSVVSHGQGELVRALLADLRPAAEAGARIVVTRNLPEDESFLTGAGPSLLVLRNTSPLGFGANHNQAFRYIGGADRFVVLNPDIRCDASVFKDLLSAADAPDAGVYAPRVRSREGLIEDSARRHPSLSRILHRVLRRMRGQRTTPDYEIDGDQPIVVDWAAGMFMMFPAQVFAEVGGFDERYFMYLEDADICRRVGMLRRPTRVLPWIEVVHDARRATSRSLKHFRWHVASMAHYLWRFRG
jgi:GT2 family glycosyltransferase